MRRRSKLSLELAIVRTEIHIDAERKRCFDAARDMGLHIESARSSGERIVAGRSEGLLEMGESVTFEGRHFGIRFQMSSEIVEFDRPNRFVDEMRSGPFKRLRHVHEFLADGSGTRMIDTFDFASPFGPFGWLADKLFVGPHLGRFMAARAQLIKRSLEAQGGI